jgi:hypothetical protein
MDLPKFEVIGDNATLRTDVPGQWLKSDCMVDLEEWA